MKTNASIAVNALQCVLCYNKQLSTTIFSIIYNADFYLYLDNADEENSRLTSLAKLCQLEDRIYWETQHLPEHIQETSFSRTNDIIISEREKSIRYLSEALTENMNVSIQYMNKDNKQQYEKQ